MFRHVVKKNIHKYLLCNYFRSCVTLSFTRNAHQKLMRNKFVRLSDNSLQPRILKYLDECTSCKYVETITVDKYSTEQLHKCSNSELNTIIRSLLNPRLKRTVMETNIKNIDKECCLRLTKLTTQEIFNYLNSFMHVVPYIITQLKFYGASLKRLNFFVSQCSKIELLQLCFYIGLQKKAIYSQGVLKECLNKFNGAFINSLNMYDLTIICSSCYKTSTKIKKYYRLLEKVNNLLFNNLIILKDTSVFITFVKSFRHNQYTSENLLVTISQVVFFNKYIEYYNFTACTHLLALYSDALYYEPNILNLLTDKCVGELRDSPTTKTKFEQIRAKDIARFLWSLSYIGYDNLEEYIITNYVIPLLEKYIQAGELKKHVEYFIDSLLSMAVLGYYPSASFFESVISKNSVSLTYGKKKQRYVARLNLLLTCVKWERPEIFSALNVKPSDSSPFPVNARLKNRPILKNVQKSLCNIASRVKIEKFELESVVPHLHIVGISGFDAEGNVRVFVEVMDENLGGTKDEFFLNGFEKLKLRLIKTLKKNIVVIFKQDVEELTTAELDKYLERKMKLLHKNPTS